MKLKTDPRHIKRISLMQTLFTWEFLRKEKPPKEITEIIVNLKDIDDAITKGATNRPLSEINKIDLAILRLAVFELIINKQQPVKVIIDEAVELGKEFGSDSSSSFVNGALGHIVNLRKIKT